MTLSDTAVMAPWTTSASPCDRAVTLPRKKRALSRNECVSEQRLELFWRLIVHFTIPAASLAETVFRGALE